MIQITPYVSVDTLRFGASIAADCRRAYGEPERTGRNREGTEELAYDRFVARFDSRDGTFRELTLLPKSAASIEGLAVTWDRTFLCAACRFDGRPYDLHGFIVLTTLGIAITGLHDDDPSQLAVSVFSRGEFDDLLSEAVPFDASGYCG